MLGRQRAPKYHSGANMRPYLRVKNVFEDRIDLSDVKEMVFDDADFVRYKLEPGDILLNEGQSPELVGRPAMYRGELPGACFTNSLIRFRPQEGVDGRYAVFLFRWHLHSGRFKREARITTNIAHLSAHRFAGVEFPLPPLAEQRRIVAAIEEHFSRLDASSTSLVRVAKLLDGLHRAAVESALAGHWGEIRVEEVGDGSRNALAIGPFGSNLKVSDYRDEGVPLIFVRNIRSGRFDGPNPKFVTADKAAELKAHVVNPGDVLVTKMGEPPGETAVYPLDRQPAILTADCIKITPSAGFDPAFLAFAIAAPPARRQILSITSGVAQKKVSLARFKTVTVPAPPRDEQRRIVAEIDQQLSLIDALHDAVGSARKRSATLRRAILERAFRGELVPQDPNDEPASVLLERIRAERAAAPKSKRRKRATA
jgi:type I restriction enzyme S subunit